MLQAIEEFGGFVGLGAEQEWTVDVDAHSESADVVFDHLLAPLKVLGVLKVHETGAAPDHEELADFFFDRHFVESLLSPLGTVAGEFDLRGWRVFRFIFGE